MVNKDETLDAREERLVKQIAYRLFNQYCPRGESGCFTREDLLHYGVIGLLTAEKNFKKELKVPFNAYAAIRIKGEIMDAVRKSPLIRIPQKKRNLVNQLIKAKNKVLDQGKIPDIQDLAKALGWNIKMVLKVEGYLSPVISIDEGPGDNDIANDLGKSNAEQDMLHKDLAVTMQKCLGAIEDVNERIVFIAREVKKMTLKQVGLKMNWCIEKTRQTQIRAKESMKSCLQKRGWDLE